MKPLTETSRSIVAYKGYMSFLVQLTEALTGHREEGERTGVLVIQLSNLGRINTTSGYKRGHEASELFGKKIKKMLRPGDWVSALSKDRFVLVLKGVKNAGHLMLAANRLVRFADSIPVSADSSLMMEVRSGGAIFPEHGSTPEELLCNAELAIESASQEGSIFAMYKSDRSQQLTEDWEIEGKLGAAIEDGEFELHYQPKIDARTLLPRGAEGLMRWNSPDFGDISTEHFIQIVERTDHIDAFTNHALHCAARDVSEWPRFAANMSVAINLPPRLLEHGNIVTMFKQVAAIWGVDIERFTAEVTENGIMSTDGAALDVLQQLRDNGIRVSIDDFGTGHSSLAYFKDIPADEVKIDKSFVFHMLTNRDHYRLVRTIIDLAHGFDLDVVAEGVETKEIVEELQKLGCDTLQGYYFSKPLSKRAFNDYLAAQDGSETAVVAR